MRREYTEGVCAGRSLRPEWTKEPLGRTRLTWPRPREEARAWGWRDHLEQAWPQTWVRNKPWATRARSREGIGTVPRLLARPGHPAEEGLPPSGLTLGALVTGAPRQPPHRDVAVVAISHEADRGSFLLCPRVLGMGLFLCAVHLLGPALVLGPSVVSAGAPALGVHQGLQPQPCRQLRAALCISHALCPLPRTLDHGTRSRMPTGSGPRVTLRIPGRTQRPVPSTHRIGPHRAGALGACSSAFWLLHGHGAPASTPARGQAGPQIRTIPFTRQQGPRPVPASLDWTPYPLPAGLQGWHGLSY